MRNPLPLEQCGMHLLAKGMRSIHQLMNLCIMEQYMIMTRSANVGNEVCIVGAG
jgi:hypothetical protein